MYALFFLLGLLIPWSWLQDNNLFIFRFTAREKLATAISTDVAKTKHILPLPWSHRLLELKGFRSKEEKPKTPGTKEVTQLWQLVAKPRLELGSRK